MFPGLPALPSDEAFLQTLGTSCGAEVSRLGANGKDDASGAAGWTFLGQFIAQPVKREAHRLAPRLSGPRSVGPFRRLRKGQSR